MDLHQSSPSSNFNENSLENQVATCSLDEEKKEDSTTEAENQAKMNPLQIGHMLEKIFGFLDVESVKAARQVNPLWSVEGAKMLISKCYINIPWDLNFEESLSSNSSALEESSSSNNSTLEESSSSNSSALEESSSSNNSTLEESSSSNNSTLEESSSNNSTTLEESSSSNGTTVEEFKSFLALKSSEISMIPAISINKFEDVELWKSLGVLGNQVTSLKMNIIDDEAELLSNLLDLLPNLKYLDFSCMASLGFDDTKGSIIKVLVSVMLEAEKDRSPLVLSRMTLQPSNVEELEDIEKLSDCKNVMFEECKFVMMPHIFINMPQFEIRVLNMISKFLTTSQNTLNALSLFFCEIYTAFLEFPRLVKLAHMDLNFSPQTPGLLCRYNISPSFRFLEKFPNLGCFGIHYEGDGQGPSDNFFSDIFENAGVASSVKSLKYSDSYLDFNIFPLFQVFPNIEYFLTINTGHSRSMFDALWKHAQNLKYLCLRINMDHFLGKVADLDFLLTGFAPETVEKIKNSQNLTLETLEDLDKLRINPSILDLKELEFLEIYFCGDSRRYLPKRMLTVAGEFAFRLLPKDARVIIDVKHCQPSPERAMETFNQVAKLPNVIVQFQGSDNDSTSFEESDSFDESGSDHDP